ncbi:MAG: putative NADH-flavin reductase [Ferruginibacter sp.]|nr:putative NADH-flavin reductase [Ferruginibacter sp.]
MTITIFGATGMVGKYLVQQALLQDFTVRAFGRNILTKQYDHNEKLHLFSGALFDETQVREAIRGTDVVLSALGGAFDGTDKTRSLGMKNIVLQMEKENVKRIVAIGGMGTLDSEDDEPIMNTAGYPKQFFAVGKEHYKAYEFLKASNLDWTFVCPPDILDAPATGSFHTAANHPPKENTFKINAGDLALFMLSEMKENHYLQQRVGISN